MGENFAELKLYGQFMEEERRNQTVKILRSRKMSPIDMAFIKVYSQYFSFAQSLTSIFLDFLVSLEYPVIFLLLQRS